MGISAVFSGFYVKVTEVFGWAKNHKVTTSAITVVGTGGAYVARAKQVNSQVRTKLDGLRSKLEGDPQKSLEALIGSIKSEDHDKPALSKLGIANDTKKGDAKTILETLKGDKLPVISADEIGQLDKSIQPKLRAFLRTIDLREDYVDEQTSETYKTTLKTATSARQKAHSFLGKRI